MPCFKLGADSSGPFSPLRRGAERLWLGRTPTLLAWPKRCVLVSMVFVGFSLAAGIRRSFVEAAYSLQRESHWKMFNNDTSSGNWTTDFIRSFQSSFTWGLFIGHVIGSALSYKYHANSVFAAAILLDSSLHLVVAGVMQVHQIFLVSLLFLQGVADGLTFPAFFSLLRYWAPPLERTRMFAAGYAGLHFGSLLSFQIFSIFESLFSSTAGLYFYGMLGILWVLPWFLLISETPSKHPGVSTREKIYIIDSLQTQEHIPFSQPTSVPMRSILSSGPVWAILLASFGRTWTYNTLLHIMQWYYNDEIRYAKEIPYFLMMVSVVVSGFVADGLQEKNLMTTSTVRKTFGGTGLLTEAVLFMTMVYVGPTDFAMVLYFFAMSIRELAVAGYMVNPLDIAPQYAGIIAGLSGAMTSLGNLTFYPMMNHIFNTWKIRHDHMTPLYAVSVISGGLQFLAALIFVVFSSATEQDWSKDEGASPSASGDALYGTSSSGGNNNNDPYLDTTEVTVSDGGISLNVIVKR